MKNQPFFNHQSLEQYFKDGIRAVLYCIFSSNYKFIFISYHLVFVIVKKSYCPPNFYFPMQCVILLQSIHVEVGKIQREMNNMNVDGCTVVLHSGQIIMCFNRTHPTCQ